MVNFKIHDQVMHFREGLSKIVEIKTMNGAEYFLVQVSRQGEEIIYVPIDKAEAIIRHIIDKKDVDELIEFARTIKPEYFNNTKQRRDNFKRRLGSGDVHDLVYLSRQLYFFYHPEILETPIKFGPADIEMLKYANTTLHDELAIALSINRDLIEDHIIKLIG